MDQSKIKMKQQGEVNVEKSVASLIEKITPSLKAIVNARAEFHAFLRKGGEYDIIEFSTENGKEMEIQEKEINIISEALQFWNPVLDNEPTTGAIKYVIK